MLPRFLVSFAQGKVTLFSRWLYLPFLDIETNSRSKCGSVFDPSREKLVAVVCKASKA